MEQTKTTIKNAKDFLQQGAKLPDGHGILMDKEMALLLIDKFTKFREVISRYVDVMQVSPEYEEIVEDCHD